MIIQTREDIESLQNGDSCFIHNPDTGELLSAVFYDSEGSRRLGTIGYWIRPCQYNARGLRTPSKEILIGNFVHKRFTITSKRHEDSITWNSLQRRT